MAAVYLVAVIMLGLWLGTYLLQAAVWIVVVAARLLIAVVTGAVMLLSMAALAILDPAGFQRAWRSGLNRESVPWSS